MHNDESLPTSGPDLTEEPREETPTIELVGRALEQPIVAGPVAIVAGGGVLAAAALVGVAEAALGVGAAYLAYVTLVRRVGSIKGVVRRAYSTLWGRPRPLEHGENGEPLAP